MIRKLVGLLTVVIVIFSACAAQKNGSSTNSLSYLQMWRTSCFGQCPSYKIEVFDDGLVRYSGSHFTEIGVFEKNISAAAAKKILAGYKAKQVDTLRDKYDMPIQDLPGIQYTFKYDNTIKQVYNAEFGPQFLREMANELDKLVNKEEGGAPRMDDSWKKISDHPKGD